MSLLFLTSALAGLLGSIAALFGTGKTAGTHSVFSKSWSHVNERLGVVRKESPLNLSWPQVAILQFTVLLLQPVIGSVISFIVLGFGLLGDLHIFTRFKKETGLYSQTILAYILLEAFMLYLLL